MNDTSSLPQRDSTLRPRRRRTRLRTAALRRRTRDRGGWCAREVGQEPGYIGMRMPSMLGRLHLLTIQECLLVRDGTGEETPGRVREDGGAARRDRWVRCRRPRVRVVRRHMVRLVRRREHDVHDVAGALSLDLAMRSPGRRRSCCCLC
jgi:hypothetical protein